MDPITMTVAVKGLGMVLLIIGGIAQILVGYKVYRHGSSVEKSGKSTLQYGQFKFQADSIGALVMGTAAFWAGAAVTITPGINKHGEDWKVSDIDKFNKAIEAPTFMANLSGVEGENVLNNPEKLESLFAEAVKSILIDIDDVPSDVNNYMTKLDLDSISTKKSAEGTIVILSDFKENSSYGHVAYVSGIKDKKIFFRPAIGFTAQPEDKLTEMSKEDYLWRRATNEKRTEKRTWDRTITHWK